MKPQLKKALEVLGVVAPIVCLIHCIATPVVLTALPFLTAGTHSDIVFHWIIVGICAVAILPAFASHKKYDVLGLFFAGAAFVLLPAYFESIEKTVPTIATALAASVCLVAANLLNRKYSKELSGATACCSTPHQSQHSEV